MLSPSLARSAVDTVRGDRRRDLLVCPLRPRTTDPAAVPRLLETVPGALEDQLVLELREGGHDVERELTD